MKRLFAPLLAAIAALCFVPAVQAQVTTVSATCLGGFIVSSTCTGAPAANASIYWQPIVAARAGTTGGQILSTPVKATVTSGAFSMSLADALAADSNTCYAVTAIDNVSGMTLLGNGLSAAGNVIQGGPYGCIQPTGSTWSFDTFVPSSSPPAVFMFGSTSMLSDWTDSGAANLDCPVWIASTGKWTPSALPCVTAKVYAGGSAPSDTCSATVNAFAIEINATPTAYLCSNATGSYAWNTLGGAGGGGLSGMTSGQVAIAGSPTTITGSEALAGAGAGIITGPVSGTTANDLVSENGTTGQVKDSGVLITAIPGGDISGAVASATSAVSFSGSLVGDVTGTQAATVVGKINGGAVPASAAVLATNSSNQPTAATPHQVVAPIQCADTSASATTYTCTTVPSIGSLTKGDTFIFSNINQNNTAGTVTLNIDGIGAKTITKWQKSATTLTAADLEAQGAATLIYDGTNLELSTVGNAPSGGGLSGMTSGQVAIAGSPTTITGSEALAGAGAGIITGPVSGTTANDLVSENGTTGQVKDSGVLITAIPGGDISGAVANATSAVSFSGSLVGDVTGTQGATVVGKINGGAVPASAAVLATNSSSQPTAATPHQVVAPIQCADTSASATTYTCTTVPSIGSLTKGDTFIFSNINQNNTAGTVTLNIDGIGAKTVSKWQNSVTTLAAADLEAQGAATLVYDGTDLELSTIGNAPSGGGNMSDSSSTSTAGYVVFTTTTSHTYLYEQQNAFPIQAPVESGPDTLMTLATSQTVTGNKLFSGSASGTTQSAGDNSTKFATTAYTNTIYNLIQTSGSPYTMTALTGSYWNNSSGSYSFDLPTPVAGLQLCFGNYKAVAQIVSLIPGSGVTIYFKGVAGTAGSSTGLVSGGAAGDFICLEGTDSTTYEAIGAGYGTWTNH